MNPPLKQPWQRAERRAGQLLQQMPKNKGGEHTHKDPTSCIVQQVPEPTYQELGIERTQAHRWQKMAELPEEELEEIINQGLEAGLHLARRKEIYEQLYPETKHGGTPGNQTTGKKRKDLTVRSFQSDTAEKTGESVSTVARKTRIGEQLQDIAAKIQGTDIEDNQKDLTAVAS